MSLGSSSQGQALKINRYEDLALTRLSLCIGASPVTSLAGDQEGQAWPQDLILDPTPCERHLGGLKADSLPIPRDPSEGLREETQRREVRGIPYQREREPGFETRLLSMECLHHTADILLFCVWLKYK